MELSTVNCPKCGTPVEISAALSKEIDARLSIEYNDRLRLQQAEADKRAEETRRSHAKELEKLSSEVSKAASAKAREQVETRLKALDEQLAEQSKELDQSHKKEAELLKTKRELEKRAADAEIVAARKMDEERKSVVAEAMRSTVEQYELKIRQKEIEAEGLKKQVHEMNTKLTQGSQQSQGEAQERSLEDALIVAFPDDEVVAVKSGTQGADVLQRVRTPGGMACGSILWESKAAKNWGGTWPEKLKADQLREKAEAAVLVSKQLPEGLEGFGEVEGVWVGNMSFAIPLGAVLREGIIQVHRANAAQEGKAEKKEHLYSYVQSPEFRQEVQRVADALWSMKAQIDAERRAFEKQWKMRDKQVQQAVLGLMGIYGSMQGVLGSSLPGIKHLELPSGDE